jgi:protein-tyrosine phosphatase
VKGANLTARHFERCLKFIAQALLDGGRVLVHCFAGKSRSATVCAAYAMVGLLHETKESPAPP